MTKIKPGVILCLILFIIWILLAGTDWNELVAGAIAAVLLSLFFTSKVTMLGNLRFTPKSFFFLILYILVFLRELVKSTLDVAGRVISPRLPINPGIVKVHTRLKNPLSRLILANSITLTPGTMTVETRDDYFYIHWIDIRTDDIEATTKAIVSTFEKYLEVIFE
jgi:multicomponent Na+:H+ antiporter subunit E